MIRAASARRRARLRLHLLLSGLLLSGPLLFDAAAAAAAADATDAHATEQQLAPIVVESSVLAPAHRLGDVVGSEHTGASAHYQGRALGGGARSVGEVLAQGVGTEVRTIGAPGSFSSVSLRGADAEQVAVYLDGLLLNEASGGGVNLAELELAQVAAIDLYRGITPIQLGHGLPGGAVNIRLPRPGEGEAWRLGLEHGAFGHWAGSALGQYASAPWRVLGAASWRQADNDFPLRNEDGGGRRHNADFTQGSGLLHLERALARERSIDGFLRYFTKEQGLPRWDNAASAATRLESEIVQGRVRWQDADLSATLAMDSAALWGLSLEAYAGHKDETYDDRGADVGLGAQHQRYRTGSAGLGSYLERVDERGTLALRSEVRAERYLGEDLQGRAEDSDAERYVLDLGLGSNTYWFADESLLVAVALRHRALRDAGDVRDTGVGSQFKRREVSDQWTNPALGVQWRLSEQVRVRANIGRYVRAPNLDELFGDRGFVRGNPDLAAEVGLNRDLGLEWVESRERDWLSEWRADISYFDNQVSDMIVRTFDSRGVGRAENVAEARLSGLETEVSLLLIPSLRLDLHATLQETEHRSAMVAFDGNQLPRRARRHYGGQLIYQQARWDVGYAVTIEEDFYFDTANRLPAEDRTRHDLSLTSRWGDNGGAGRRGGEWSVETSVRNLTDERYEDFRGHPRPGRSWHLGVSYGAAQQ
ncbi:TonB-dependent receptor domain-containing protein [Halorhodospira abdelmalekii]|uniref:TonB-dependent receptor domain-containing protein n=1 Tax=Halorhodospira abdelmalekii TaxID=421629 RepID=UPI0019073F51